MVTVAADAREVDHPLEGSGVVVARTSDLSITACSFGSSKWAHWDDGRHVVFRLSRSEEHTSELQSLMRISYAVFCLKKKKTNSPNEDYVRTWRYASRISV